MSPTKKSDRDPQDMRGRVMAWPDLLERGYGASVTLPAALAGKRQIVCAGMGGSAIGASLVGDYADFKVPFTVVRDYELPGSVDAHSLVICISYSGGTEETLACFEQARDRGAAVLVVTTGGELATRAGQADVPCLTIDYDSQPRAALPVVLGLLLKVLGSLNYLPDQAEAVAEASSALRGVDPSPAIQLAKELVGVIPIVYGAGLTADAARRLKGQISENAKQTAAWEVLPEQNHNALVGLTLPADLKEHTRFVFVRAKTEHPRHTKRFAIVQDLLDDASLSHSELRGSGGGRLAQLTTVLFLGDLSSVELAYANKVDPTPVEVIDRLKARLAETG